MQAVFSHGNGILWRINESEPWIQLAVNSIAMLAISLWAGTHSLAVFGVLKYFDLLRIDAETEYHGCDVTKHGEMAYPLMSATNNCSSNIAAEPKLQSLGAPDDFKMPILKMQDEAEIKYDTTITHAHLAKPCREDIDIMAMENFNSILNACKVKLKDEFPALEV